MRFKLEKIFNDDGKLSASAKGLSSPMHVSIFGIPASAKVGDVINALPIKKGGGCSIFYNFESFDK